MLPVPKRKDCFGRSRVTFCFSFVAIHIDETPVERSLKIPKKARSGLFYFGMCRLIGLRGQDVALDFGNSPLLQGFSTSEPSSVPFYLMENLLNINLNTIERNM